MSLDGVELVAGAEEVFLDGRDGEHSERGGQLDLRRAGQAACRTLCGHAVSGAGHDGGIDLVRRLLTADRIAAGYRVICVEESHGVDGRPQTPSAVTTVGPREILRP